MATVKPMPTSILNRLADSLATTQHSLNQRLVGKVVRVQDSDREWDVSKPWVGRELTGWKSRKTLWNNSTIITLYTLLTSTPNQQHPLFTVTLEADTPQSEIETAALTYMMLLNLQRRDK